MNIAINGFGRIGRATFKILLERNLEDLNIVAINDLGALDNMAYLLKYDSVFGVYDKDVKAENDSLIVDGKSYRHISVKDPLALPWRDLNVDVVIECTGIFTHSADAQKHLDAGAKKVVLSAPASDDGFKTLVFGSGDFDANHSLISNASCTTNCITPVMRILIDNFGVEKALLNTIHAYTSTQSLVDGPATKDFRRGRAAAHNISPSSTGAATATGKAIPEVNGIFDGIAMRVPVICGSVADVTALLKRDVTVEEVNNAFKEAQDKDLFRGILKYTEEPLVSSDIIKSSYSAVVDGQLTTVVGGNLVKVVAWYDNEWGYSNRLVDMSIKAARNM